MRTNNNCVGGSHMSLLYRHLKFNLVVCLASSAERVQKCKQHSYFCRVTKIWSWVRLSTEINERKIKRNEKTSVWDEIININFWFKYLLRHYERGWQEIIIPKLISVLFHCLSSDLWWLFSGFLSLNFQGI